MKATDAWKRQCRLGPGAQRSDGARAGVQVSWLLSVGLFPCHDTHSFTIFAAHRGGSEIAQTWGACSPVGGQPRRGPAGCRLSASLAAGKASLEEELREAWDSGLRPAPSLLLASCWQGSPSEPLPPPAQQADSACAYGHPTARRARGRYLFRSLVRAWAPARGGSRCSTVAPGLKLHTLEQNRS